MRRLYFLGVEGVAEVSGEADVEAIETEELDLEDRGDRYRSDKWERCCVV